MKIIQRNIPIFGPERSSFVEVLRQYSSTKAAYDGAIYNYRQVNYDSLLLGGDRGNAQVRIQFTFSKVMMVFNILRNTDEAIGFEFDIPIRKGFKVDVLAELWPWDYSERLAHAEVKGAFYHSPSHKSGDNIFYDEEKDEYVYLTIVLNKEEPADLNTKDTFLQKKILRIFNDTSRDLLERRLFILRVKQMIEDPNAITPDDRLDRFDCRDDSVVIELTGDPDFVSGP